MKKRFRNDAMSGESYVNKKSKLEVICENVIRCGESNYKFIGNDGMVRRFTIQLGKKYDYIQYFKYDRQNNVVDHKNIYHCCMCKKIMYNGMCMCQMI